MLIVHPQTQLCEGLSHGKIVKEWHKGRKEVFFVVVVVELLFRPKKESTEKKSLGIQKKGLISENSSKKFKLT